MNILIPLIKFSKGALICSWVVVVVGLDVLISW
jgi:hypothetical protein